MNVNLTIWIFFAFVHPFFKDGTFQPIDNFSVRFSFMAIIVSYHRGNFYSFK
jgi:hypothetical protein